MFLSFYQREINIAWAEMSQTVMFAVGTRPCKPDANLYPFVSCGVCLFPVGWIANNCNALKAFHELISMEPIQTRGTLESIKRLQSWKDNGTGWHGWVILFLKQQLCLNIDADKAENFESRTALNRSPSNVTLTISLTVPGCMKGNLIGPCAVPYLDYKWMGLSS